jgi:indole-3-glycerol phosphate synthase/phosphoribosylanthranilate isomerase/anthranilate synthase/indole-3-glycerol phosphate synthase/phosphoribosylanthranilate isomerase
MFLEQIVAQTHMDVKQRKQELPLTEMMLRAVTQPPPRDLLEALRPGGTEERNLLRPNGSPISRNTSQIRLIAEVKRASPSKGLLAPQFDPVKLARTYATNGAAAISVLTEPHFFLGSLQHLQAIKQAVNVPVLRKDFILDEYQVYESRAWGADAILLICAILKDELLRHLLKVAQEQRMRCLVEVHSIEEAQRAVAAGATIIGVNSRDLATFQLNPYLIRDLWEIRHIIPADRVVVAESGIHTVADARRLARYDVQAMLVGESLVVSMDIPAQMRSLLHGANESVQVKICGLRTHEHLNAAIEADADLIGLMFHEPSHRYIQPEQVRMLLENTRFSSGRDKSGPHKGEGQTTPDLVGVFVNKDADFINDVVEQVKLSVVQLHGNESPEFCQLIKRPVIKALRLEQREDSGIVQAYRETAWRILLDTPSVTWGGTGVAHNWSLARNVAQEVPIFLAGGLTPGNAAQAIAQVHPWGVDVSSGVETNKNKDIEKIRAFIENVRQYTA